MTIRPTTVDVPDAFAPMFMQAEEYVRRFFADRQRRPELGSITISGERYILVRAASMSVEFFDLVLSLYRDRPPGEAWSVASNLLFDMAHAIGKADAKNLQQKMGVKDPIDRLSAGPIHFAFSGWAFVRILPESTPTPDENYFLIYDHPYSFEADAWLRQGRRSDAAVCIMNAGYSSGWCEESFGMPLVAVEVECRARGDERCRFIMAPPSRIERHVEAYFAKTRRAGSPLNVGTAPGGSVAVPEFFQRKRMEEEVRASHELLEQRVRERTAELRAANEKLESEIAERRQLEAQLLHAQKMESIGRLAGGIAHDFNNHLTAIIGYLSLAEAFVDPSSPMAEHLAAIRDASTRASNLTRQLLTFARRQVIEPKIVDPGVLVAGLAGMLQALLGETRVLRLARAQDLWPVRVDPTQIEQVVVNLIVNARDAMPIGGAVTVEIANRTLAAKGSPRAPDEPAPGDYVVLSVRDSGVGMPAEVLSHVFEPFFTTKAPGAGTGLGLATSYGIVTQSGGAMTVRSTPGQGSVFSVFLPRASGRAARHSMSGETGPTIGPGVTVLLVEDSAQVREVTARLLRRMGCRVIEAAAGDQALELFDRHRNEISIVLSDILMPGLDGRELIQRLRAKSPSLPAVLMSGFIPVDAADTPRPAGVGFLQKPFTPEQLSEHICGALAPA